MQVNVPSTKKGQATDFEGQKTQVETSQPWQSSNLSRFVFLCFSHRVHLTADLKTEYFAKLHGLGKYKLVPQCMLILRLNPSQSALGEKKKSKLGRLDYQDKQQNLYIW